MPAEPHLHRRLDGKRATRRRGRAVAELAGRQYGVVEREQLRRLGASADVIDGWIARGRLVALHRGVYAVGHRVLTVEGRWMAAVLAGGDRAALSHASAGDHWALTGLRRPLAHVTVARRRRARPGIVVHQSVISEDEVTVHEGIRVTTVARTLLDLAACVSPPRLRQAIAIAEARRLADSPSLIDLFERYPGRRGRSSLRAALDEASIGIARSELEARFLEFLELRAVAPPRVNAPVEVGGRTLIVDCLWPAARLVVELDSRRAPRRLGGSRGGPRPGCGAARRGPSDAARDLAAPALRARPPCGRAPARAQPLSERAITRRWISFVPS